MTDQQTPVVNQGQPQHLPQPQPQPQPRSAPPSAIAKPSLSSDTPVNHGTNTNTNAKPRSARHSALQAILGEDANESLIPSPSVSPPAVTKPLVETGPASSRRLGIVEAEPSFGSDGYDELYANLELGEFNLECFDGTR